MALTADATKEASLAAIIDNAIRRFWSKADVRGPDECWLWKAAIDRRSGYGKATSPRNGHMFYASRVAWEITRGHPGTFHVCHKCDVRLCVNPNHLFLGTPKDNVRDALAKGRMIPPPRNDMRGENSGTAKLTREQVILIRSLLADGNLLQREIASKFGVDSNTIHNIKKRKTWGWLE